MAMLVYQRATGVVPSQVSRFQSLCHSYCFVKRASHILDYDNPKYIKGISPPLITNHHYDNPKYIV